MQNSPKIAIQASLDELDSLQAQKVLRYIKGLLGKHGRNRNYYQFRQEAMKDIQNALNDGEPMKVKA